jgi:hypothetical protein
MRIGIDGKVMSSHAGGIGTSALNLARSCVREAGKTYPQLEFVIFTGPHTCLDGIEGINWTVDERSYSTSPEGSKSSASMSSTALITSACHCSQRWDGTLPRSMI